MEEPGHILNADFKICQKKMVKAIQFDLFKDPEICRLEAEIAEAKASTDRVRKGMYARLNKLEKLCNEISEENEFLKRQICRGTIENR